MPPLLAATAIATVQSPSNGAASPLVRGAFIARTSDPAVRRVADARGRAVEAAGAGALCGGMAQQLAMRSHGVDLLVDPAQVRLRAGDAPRLPGCVGIAT